MRLDLSSHQRFGRQLATGLGSRSRSGRGTLARLPLADTLRTPGEERDPYITTANSMKRYSGLESVPISSDCCRSNSPWSLRYVQCAARHGRAVNRCSMDDFHLTRRGF